MSIVTKTGDNGTTGLLGGSRVSKASPRLHAYGTVDELNAILGLVLTEEGLSVPILSHIHSLQHTLFRLGADLSAPATLHTERMTEEDVMDLEKWIAILEQHLPPLQNFIVPVGCRSTALLHHARTVCRRAERWVIAVTEKEEVNTWACIFLNRMSDYLFLAARSANVCGGREDIRVESQSARRPISASRNVT